jgi:hypothetical protein
MKQPRSITPASAPSPAPRVAAAGGAVSGKRTAVGRKVAADKPSAVKKSAPAAAAAPRRRSPAKPALAASAPAASTAVTSVAAPRKIARVSKVSKPARKSAVDIDIATVAPASQPAANGAVEPNGLDLGGFEHRDKPRKPKLVRDSFTMPESEYAKLGEVKKACLKSGYEVRKSELLRVGVALVGQMDLDDLKDLLAALPPLKAGRPPKS